MFLWTTAAQVALRMETMHKAEAGLIALASHFGDREASNYKMELFDTEIPASVLPFKKSCKSYIGWNLFGSKEDEDEEQLTMHAIRVTQEKDNGSTSTTSQPSQYPLVIVHGYMNGALYFYRNLVALTRCFDTVISVDLLGWGLSSRPSFDRLRDDSVETAEDFFVESLESWRSTNKIEKMNLAGHSMGGYLSVAYCEKYPERVDNLLLLSPAGVPDITPERREEQKARFYNSVPRKLVYGFFAGLWENGYTPGSVMRAIPESQGRYLVEGYVDKRLPSIRDPEEQAILAEYMYTGSILPGSGEYGLSRLLNPGAYAKKPLLHRIPKLGVRKISFLYGEKDWMDIEGGLDVQTICKEKREGINTNRNATATSSVPEINVYQVRDAGHLLMLENSSAFNAALMVAAGLDPSKIRDASDLPIVVTATIAPAKANTNLEAKSGNGKELPLSSNSSSSGEIQVSA